MYKPEYYKLSTSSCVAREVLVHSSILACGISGSNIDVMDISLLCVPFCVTGRHVIVDEHFLQSGYLNLKRIKFEDIQW